MSRFSSKELFGLTPYIPGEQPSGKAYVKLNTNESPYTLSEKALGKALGFMRKLNLYPDPTCSAVRERIGALWDLDPHNVICGNGSDEILFFAMRAFCGRETPAVFPDITYSFYKTLAGLCAVPYEEVPLRDDFSVDVEKLSAMKGTIFLANPNAPTGIFLDIEQTRYILEKRKDELTILDEAYVDFGGTSAARLTKEYDNLLVVGTFSKSCSLAGARAGFALGDRKLIEDMNLVKSSLNPYNVSSVSQALICGVLSDEESTRENLAKIIASREYVTKELEKLGFRVVPSKANFVFASPVSQAATAGEAFSGAGDISKGRFLYEKLKEKGVLVRHFDAPRIEDFIRVSIGTPEEMDIFLEKTSEILKENGGEPGE